MMRQDIFTKDQRLVILRSLEECGYDANESILSDCLDMYGHDISRDLVRNHLLWLEEQGLITLARLNYHTAWVGCGTRSRFCGRRKKAKSKDLNPI